MQTVDCLLQFLNPTVRVIRIGRIRTFRHIVINRIIAPVILSFRIQLIHGSTVIIEHRQKLHMRNTQRLQIIQTGSKSFVRLSSFLCKGQIFSPMLHITVGIMRKITHMQFINNRILCRIKLRRRNSCRLRIDHNPQLTVGRRRTHIRVGDNIRFTVYRHFVHITLTVKVTCLFNLINALICLNHRQFLFDRITLVQKQVDACRRRCPNFESCFLFSINSSKFAGISIFTVKKLIFRRNGIRDT